MKTRSSASRWARASSAWVLPLLALLWAPTVLAQDSGARRGPPITAVVIDMQLVLREAASAAALRSIEAAERLALRQRLDGLSEALRQEEELLARQRDDMDKDAFDVRVRDFDHRVRAARQEAQETSIAFQNRFSEAFNALEKEAMPVIMQIMAEHSAQVALDKRSVLVVADSADITAEVIRRLDVTLPAGAARDLLPPMPGPR